MDSLQWTLCFLKLIFALFLHVLFSLWLLQCCAHKCLSHLKKKALICIVCICTVFDFHFNYQCEVTEQGARKRGTQLVLLYHWAITDSLTPANSPYWDFKTKFSSSAIFFYIFLFIRRHTGSESIFLNFDINRPWELLSV